MSNRRVVLIFCSTVLISTVGRITVGQQTAVQVAARDPQAVSILTQCLSAAGGMQAISTIKDITATGTITYNGTGQPEKTPVTIKSLGLHQFRLEVAHSEGMHTSVVGRKGTFHRNPDGSVSPLPPQNGIKPTSTIFPLLHILAALQDTSFKVTYSGLVSHNHQQVHEILVQQIFPANQDPHGELSKIATTQFFVDPNALTIQAMGDRAYRRDGEPGESSHEVQFSDYRNVNGILVAFSLAESVADQQRATIHLSEVSFNNGLTEADFE